MSSLIAARERPLAAPDLTRAAAAPGRAAKAEAVSSSNVLAAVVFCAVHAGLALAMRRVPTIATVHGVAVLSVGLFYAATTRRIQRIAFVVAYIVGSEVLWRMCKAGLFWEYGKYASMAVLLLATARLAKRRTVKLAAAYVLLLVPSIAMTLEALDLSAAREQISFALAGPACLACAVVFFSSTRLTKNEMRITFVGLIAPVIGIAALSFVSAQAAKELDFVNAANAATSGGFGPNQVSAMLGLGMMLLLLMSMDARLPWRLRAPSLLLATVLGAQAALTFSRGGIVLALMGAGGALFFLIRANARARITIALVGLILGLLGRYVIEPRLEEATGGMLTERYSNFSSTGRDLFALSELEMFAQHPALGVGPGVGIFLRKEASGVQGASHTEYSRMLGEHGILGVLSLICLLALAFGAIKAAPDLARRSTATALVVWALGFMGIYATRLAAPAFAIGFAYAAARLQIPEPRNAS
jgi:O-antigen ligase